MKPTSSHKILILEYMVTTPQSEETLFTANLAA